jgi:formiminoglutamate deiminase
MGEALIAAAADAGVRLTLLDTCYLAGGIGTEGYVPVDGVQRRFSDGDAEGWAIRHGALKERDGVRIGAAVHSVRAVPPEQVPVVVAGAAAGPLHVHLSEQPAENEACLALHGRTPAAVLAGAGVWDAAATAVHATHLTGDDVALLGAAGVGVCACPSTEADLADGVGPFRRLRDAGSPLCLGSDQHVAADLLGEARALEAYGRIATGRRGTFAPGELVEALTAAGQRAIGWPDAGRLEPGARADLVAVSLDGPRTAGADPVAVASVAAADDVTDVIVDGRHVVRAGVHALGDVGHLLRTAIEPLREDA